VIGLGAIGGSLAWQARLAGVRRVVGFSPDRREGVEALKASAITDLADSPASAVHGAELVILAVPPQPTLDLIAELARRLDKTTLLSDVCSIKAAVVEQAQSAGIADRFAGAHPLAGTHESGFQSARPDRLRGCIVYIWFWERTLEASPVRIDAEVHDRQLAWTSHLPQAVACALSRCLAQHSEPGVSYGTGARDTTRLAASSPDMWTDILLHNAVAVQAALERTESQLSELRQLLTRADAAGLLSYLREAQAFRRGLDR
jgi:prephenate dehydrogenase